MIEQLNNEYNLYITNRLDELTKVINEKMPSIEYMYNQIAKSRNIDTPSDKVLLDGMRKTLYFFKEREKLYEIMYHIIKSYVTPEPIFKEKADEWFAKRTYPDNDDYDNFNDLYLKKLREIYSEDVKKYEKEKNQILSQYEYINKVDYPIPYDDYYEREFEKWRRIKYTDEINRKVEENKEKIMEKAKNVMTYLKIFNERYNLTLPVSFDEGDKRNKKVEEYIYYSKKDTTSSLIAKRQVDFILNANYDLTKPLGVTSSPELTKLREYLNQYHMNLEQVIMKIERGIIKHPEDRLVLEELQRLNNQKMIKGADVISILHDTLLDNMNTKIGLISMIYEILVERFANKIFSEIPVTSKEKEEFKNKYGKQVLNKYDEWVELFRESREKIKEEIKSEVKDEEKTDKLLIAPANLNERGRDLWLTLSDIEEKVYNDVKTINLHNYFDKMLYPFLFITGEKNMIHSYIADYAKYFQNKLKEGWFDLNQIFDFKLEKFLPEFVSQKPWNNYRMKRTDAIDMINDIIKQFRDIQMLTSSILSKMQSYQQDEESDQVFPNLSDQGKMLIEKIYPELLTLQPWNIKKGSDEGTIGVIKDKLEKISNFEIKFKGNLYQFLMMLLDKYNSGLTEQNKHLIVDMNEINKLFNLHLPINLINEYQQLDNNKVNVLLKRDMLMEINKKFPDIDKLISEINKNLDPRYRIGETLLREIRRWERHYGMYSILDLISKQMKLRIAN